MLDYSRLFLSLALLSSINVLASTRVRFPLDCGQLLEKRWAYEQAKEREMAEVCEFMGVDPPIASSSRQQEKRDKLDKRKSKEERASAGSERDDALSDALDLS